ncbi:adenosylhomocysteinase [Kordiimonas sp. SCSIO 12603]|uniref:adenosylhomocysteinase n=1 Tax=Kordiimonas sp. SCSIO 12603 TaxID=2829596 RepID=UPI00210211A5|nr:adenosylhomocysteinase [Kordiimonas sp. SCSIO 12603]UTW59585.1 adenosylhomocysteinase [Kordiimonas sp. SCSIO 12603]
MNYEKTYEIEDINLAPSGRKRIEWARANMPITHSIGERFEREKPFQGKAISICLHLEAKTGVWLEALRKGGADIAITGSPGTTQDDTAAALVADMGISVFTRKNESFEEHLSYYERVLEFTPDLIADNGGDLHHLIYQHSEFSHLQTSLIGATEETTTGANRIRREELTGNFPTFVINDTQAKRIVENRFGVGSSVMDGIMRATNIMLHGKRAVVIGYGYCGSGVAQRLRGLGAHVVVVEANPLTRLEAHLEGFQTADLTNAVSVADLVITVTGERGVLGAEHFAVMQDKTIIANAGHFASEISVDALADMSTTSSEVREHITAYSLCNDNTLYLLAGGNPVNLAAGDGNPIEIMDLGLALQALSLERLVLGAGDYENTPQIVPEDIERLVAEGALKYWAGV